MGLGCGLEVRYERAARFDGDDRAVVLPICSKSVVSRRWRSAGEVSASQNAAKSESSRSACAAAVGGWREALDLVLEGLAAHDVLRLGEVAEHVEVLQAA